MLADFATHLEDKLSQLLCKQLRFLLFFGFPPDSYSLFLLN